MATVDFTLDELLEATSRQTRAIVQAEVRGVVQEEVRGVVLDVVPGVVRDVMCEEFKPLFDEAFEPYAMAIQQDFVRLHDRIDRLEHGMKSVKRVLSV